MKQILLIGSLLMLVSSCEKAAVISVFATVFLKNANKPLADLETEVVTFVDGKGSTRYPVYSWSNLKWMQNNLGTIT